jgi:FlaA1/EpsC-like NDP-sugar epimerase
MSEMITFNHRSTMSYVFAFIDGLLVLAVVLLSGLIHPSIMDSLFRTGVYPVTKIMLVVVVVEMTHYYLDLLDLKFIRGRIQMSLQLCKALGVYSVVLVVIYFLLPPLAIGHRALFVSLGLIFSVTFSLRLLYPWIASNVLFKERVLIVGTGDLAMKICREIEENGLGAYEIVGFVDENGKRVGEKIRPDDHRGVQANLFHLQNLSN